MTIVTMAHCRQIMRPNGKGLCARGMRAFAKRHDIDYLKFVQEGIDAEVLEATNNAFAQKAVEIARAEEAENRGK